VRPGAHTQVRPYGWQHITAIPGEPSKSISENVVNYYQLFSGVIIFSANNF
jgi:hypothetical protein